MTPKRVLALSGKLPLSLVKSRQTASLRLNPQSTHTCAIIGPFLRVHHEDRLWYFKREDFYRPRPKFWTGRHKAAETVFLPNNPTTVVNSCTPDKWGSDKETWEALYAMGVRAALSGDTYDSLQATYEDLVSTTPTQFLEDAAMWPMSKDVISRSTASRQSSEPSSDPLPSRTLTDSLRRNVHRYAGLLFETVTPILCVRVTDTPAGDTTHVMKELSVHGTMCLEAETVYGGWQVRVSGNGMTYRFLRPDTLVTAEERYRKALGIICAMTEMPLTPLVDRIGKLARTALLEVR